MAPWLPGGCASACGNSLYGFIKEKVAQKRYTDTDELKQAVTDALKC